MAAIAQTECILSLKKCMENERDLIATCCETLTRLFKCQHVSWNLRVREKLFYIFFPFTRATTQIELTFILSPVVAQDSLIRQSLECMLIQYLLGLLKSRANLSNNPATVIAQIVSALKTMAQNLNYGDQVLHILNSDPIWAEFKDQNHDLFIMDTHKRGMIAGESRSSGNSSEIFINYFANQVRRILSPAT